MQRRWPIAPVRSRISCCPVVPGRNSASAKRLSNVSSSLWIRGRSCSLPLAVNRESIWSRLSHRTTKSSNGMPMRIAMARR
ncbi:DUF2826 domain-containing protein [Collinsella sp. AF04-24]|nr:DUF2826 domain-containing protein [Collinsella sp. TM09-10AT]RGU44408.1 DUF2826 domain-containing protein [Collinsella sp. AF16-8]RGV40890.1 DUF2826 domain-containing protein [Collinsella sp. AF14-35]RGX19707.1 DUF2826 domain-containing protein [Collinsella sp. AF04-24]